jgi:hypothetical protein
MIKASHSDTPSADSADTAGRNMESWAKDAQAHSLRVELSDESCFLLPYAHLRFASLQREEASELLHISFTSHEIHVRGRNLRALALAVQKLSVDWIRELPPRYEGLAVPDGAFIAKIEIQEAAEETE